MNNAPLLDSGALLRFDGVGKYSHTQCSDPARELQARSASLPVIATFNDKYRVIDDPLQWIVQARHGNRTRPGPDGPVTVEQWRDVAFCRTRKGVMDSVRERFRDYDPDAMRAILALPERHSNGPPADGA